MDIRVFSPDELRAVLRALRNVAVADAGFSDSERALVEGIAHIHGVNLAADTLLPITPDELARVVTDPHSRKRAVQVAIVMSLVEGTPSPRTEWAVQKLAAALDVSDEGLAVLYEISHGHAMSARLDMLRRVRRFMTNVEGAPSFWQVLSAVMGVGGGDAEMAARYQALEHCAPGTLGRAFYDHFRDNGFKLPGEPGSVPLVFHDLGHVLSGYGTDPQSEIQQAAFQAGFVREDGFTFLLFGILQFHLGLRITPVAKGFHHLFDVPRVLEALRRGAGCKVDLVSGYDLFADKDRALEEVRAELGIDPTAANAA